MASGGTFDAELELTTQRGRVRWMRIIGQVERDETGAPVRMWGTVQDITESKAREIELRQAKEAAEQAERLKAAFLANVSHEIRTPLTSVIGFSEILEEEVQGAHLRRFATLIGSSGRRLLDTINSVLALSRLEAESGDLSFEAVDLAEVAREVVDLLAFRTDADAPALTLDLPDEPVACQGNRTALHRVLLNLLSNAVKFTPSDERVTLRVEPNVGAHRDLVLLVVSDTGIGMDDAFQERLFQPFSQEADQGDPARRVHEGSGLGLAITKRLVDQMHGTIAVESTKGVGSTFTVTLPQAPSG
jgi:signal transduction histidine kinase